nr:oxytocin/vasopressin-like peptide [Stylochoplana pusilla]
MKIIVVIAVLMFSNVVISCFIRNCPPGGKKRSQTQHIGANSMHQCSICAGGRGRCVGPNICCGDGFGCVLYGEAAASCAIENENPHPCMVTGRSCGRQKDGNCAADGVCCTSESCSLANECRKPLRRNKGLAHLMNVLFRSEDSS